MKLVGAFVIFFVNSDCGNMEMIIPIGLFVCLDLFLLYTVCTITQGRDHHNEKSEIPRACVNLLWSIYENQCRPINQFVSFFIKPLSNYCYGGSFRAAS